MNKDKSSGTEVVDFIENEFNDVFENEKQLKFYIETIQGKDFIFIDGFTQDYEDPEKTQRAIEALLVFKYKEILYQDDIVHIVVGSILSPNGIEKITENAIQNVNNKISKNLNLNLIEHLKIQNPNHSIDLLTYSSKVQKALYVTYGGDEDCVERLKYTEKLGIHQEIYPKYELDSQVLMFNQLDDPDFRSNPVLDEQIEIGKI